MITIKSNFVPKPVNKIMILQIDSIPVGKLMEVSPLTLLLMVC